MNKIIHLSLLIGLLFICSGCIELIEETTVHEDGTGTYQLTINMSGSTTRINSMMALDSIDGKKVPSKEEMQHKLKTYTSQFNQYKGISNASSSLNTEKWILKLSCDFSSLTNLRNAIIAFSENINDKKASEKVQRISLDYSGNTYTRKIGAFVPKKWQKEIRSDKDYKRLNSGKCVFIQRFDSEIKDINSAKVQCSKNKKAAMLMITPKELINNPKLLDYAIVLDN